MPISLSQLTANRKACTVTFEGVADVLHVEYYPQRLTAKMVAGLLTNSAADPERVKLMTAEQQAEAVSLPVPVLTELLASWDLTAEDGGPVLPIDAAVLAELGLLVLWQILNTIILDGNTQGKAPAPTA